MDWLRLVPLLGPASAAVARYEGLLLSIPNPDVLLSPLTSQEAVLSSRIEGTQATLGEVLEFEAEGAVEGADPERQADIQEVLNYRRALREASRLLIELPFSQRLVRQTHEVLMQGVRGRNKAPGEYRRIQNWLGPAGSSLTTARFVPCPAENLPAAMDAWENYIHSNEPDVLVQLAIVHAEFEAIHPFLDGNGRLGRLIVPLFLQNKGLLSSPNFYLSEFLETHRIEYYERLLAISENGDWTGWCEFFLTGVTTQADSNQRKAAGILDLYRSKKEWIVDLARSQHSVRALDYIFRAPIFRSPDFITHSGIPKPTAIRILRLLRDNGMVREIRPSSGRRPATLAFPELLNIAEGRRVF